MSTQAQHNIVTKGILSYSYERPTCEHCHSPNLTPTGILHINGNPQSMYTCERGHFTTGLTSSKKQLLNAQVGNATVTITDTIDGSFAAVSNNSLNLNTAKIEEKIKEQTNHIQQMNSNISKLMTSLESLIQRIDEAKLADPLISLQNRIKNFELR